LVELLRSDTLEAAPGLSCYVMRALGLVGALTLTLLAACSDCPGELRTIQVPDGFALPGLVLARNGRVTATWTDASGEYQVATLSDDGAPRTVHEFSMQPSLGAAGEQSAFLLDLGDGVTPWQAALVADTGVREITLDIPALQIDVVFDGTTYQLLWTDNNDFHEVSIDENGLIGTDYVIGPRPSSSPFVRGASAGSNVVLAVFPPSGPNSYAQAYSIDSSSHAVQWIAPVEGETLLLPSDRYDPTFSPPVWFDGAYRMASSHAITSLTPAGVSTEVVLAEPERFESLLAGTNTLFGKTVGGLSSGVVRFDGSLQTYQYLDLPIDLSNGIVWAASSGDDIIAFDTTGGTDPRGELSVVRFSSTGAELWRRPIATNGPLIGMEQCIVNN